MRWPWIVTGGRRDAGRDAWIRNWLIDIAVEQGLRSRYGAHWRLAARDLALYVERQKAGAPLDSGGEFFVMFCAIRDAWERMNR